MTARGVIKLNSLVLAIDTIQKGPGKTVDIEEKILAAISEGINTKRKNKDELGITEEDWVTYSQVLKKEGKIECSRHKWSICSGAKLPMGRTRRPLRGHLPERRVYNFL